MTLEYVEPAAVEFAGEVVLAVIVHGYRSHASAILPQAAGSCNVNINCPEAAGWENQKRSVARLIMNGNTLCTGTLINNTRNGDKPYFMTANHCIGSLDALSNADASGCVFYSNFESASCAGTSGPETQTTAGATVRANNSAVIYKSP
ncbi:MAG: hypothetical protein H7282_03060 [Cytophagaceae bacterium]|nr:hypothetical protein [Cytophagaceae bacterium]